MSLNFVSITFIFLYVIHNINPTQSQCRAPVAPGIQAGDPYLSFIHLLNDPDTVLWEIQEYLGSQTYCKYFHVPTSSLTPVVPCNDPNIRPWKDDIGSIDPANTTITHAFFNFETWEVQLEYYRNNANRPYFYTIKAQNPFFETFHYDQFTFANTMSTTFVLLTDGFGTIEIHALIWPDILSTVPIMSYQVPFSSQATDVSWKDWDYPWSSEDPHNVIVVYEDEKAIRVCIQYQIS